MINILGIIGSPRKLGNSELIIKEVSRQISIPHVLQLLRLHDFTIQPCKGCYQCFIKEKCVIDDDFQIIISALLKSDAIIIAAPTYFLGINATIRNLVNRGLAFQKYLDDFWGKPAIGIGICGIAGKEGYSLLDIENFLAFLLTENKKSIMINGALPGEIFLTDKNLELAKELARALFDPKMKKTTPCCPLCGGETFRFLDQNRIMCMLCSNQGEISFADNGPVITIHRGQFPMFLSKEDLVKHKKWLMGMKERFIARKRELKAINIRYLDDGQWIVKSESPQ